MTLVFIANDGSTVELEVFYESGALFQPLRAAEALREIAALHPTPAVRKRAAECTKGRT